MAGYARGKYAKGQCRRCGHVFPRRALREDGETGLIVCADCYDEPHPAERPFNATDNQMLYKPANDLDKAASTGAVTPLVSALGFENTFGGGT